MVFSSIIFLFYFIPVFFLLYYISPPKFKNIVCLFGSIFFYAWGEPYYVLLMLLSILVNFWFGQRLDYERPQKARKRTMVVACAFNIVLLVVFKYLSFMMQEFAQLTGSEVKTITISLPLGISFYTFQALSYILDVYKKQVPVQHRYLNLALYICMFPQLVAGPIVRYGDINEEINNRELKIPEISAGIIRFLIGLGKKVLIANVLGGVADTIWSIPNLNISVTTAWIGIVAYTLQIYFDFSGYSDMAIGLGLMMGFHFVENFNYPYISKSISEFWRRWHISLGTWFRDYVYFPLGGSRTSTLKLIRNLLIVWTLTGIWHGADWTFLLWGAYYGVLICLEKVFHTETRKSLSVLQHVGCLLAVMVGWVLFRSDSVLEASTYLGRMIGIGANSLFDATAVLYLHDYFLLFFAAGLGCTPLLKYLYKYLTRTAPEEFLVLLRCCCVIVLLSLCTLYLVNSTYNPFIYFRF